MAWNRLVASRLLFIYKQIEGRIPLIERDGKRRPPRQQEIVQIFPGRFAGESSVPAERLRLHGAIHRIA